MTQNNNIATTTKHKVGILIILLISVFANLTQAQSPAADSLVINVGSSQIIFLVNDKDDLKKLKEYDLNAILEKLSLKLDERDSSQDLTNNGRKVADTTIVVSSDLIANSLDRADEAQEYARDRVEEADDYRRDRDYDRDDNYDRDRDDRDRNSTYTYSYSSNSDRDDRDRRRSRRRNYGTHHSFNINLGTNNFLMEGEFPDDTNEIYSVRPWGSWYVELGSINQSRIAGPLYLDWGFNLSWYNFKFQNDRVLLIEGEEEVTFIEDNTPEFSFDKSKLSVVYLNASFVPVFGFGGRNGNRWKWRGKGSFRIGAGGYAGYRVFSYTKVKFDDGNDTEKDFEYDNFFLNNFRYGARVQIGFGFTDLFFNYDLNELFQEDRGPKLNAFSFGITL